ncbi:MAG: hypothetical protein L6R36_004805 [Xanthoria steineri]|nr:MAG: hypothetical protein L6R36_004805 [Xanthoria steineri]
MNGHGRVQPMSVEQIVEQAENFEYNSLVPFKHWSRSAGTLIKEAEIYDHEGNEQQAYLLLFRHARLILDKLPTHPEARSKENDTVLQHLRKDVLRNISKLEKLKPRINKRYDRYQAILKERSQAKAANTQALAASRRVSADAQTQRGPSRPPSDWGLAHSSEALTAGDNRDLAVKLAHKEIRRRATARKATRQAGFIQEDEQERRTARVWGDQDEAWTKDEDSIDQDTLSRDMHNVRMQVNGSTPEALQQGSSHPAVEDQKSHILYPSVPPKSARGQQAYSHSLPDQESEDFRASYPTYSPPQRPSKTPNNLVEDSLPQRPKKEAITHTPPSRSDTASPVPQDLKPSTFTFQPSAYLENGTPLRTIFLPPDLRHRFLSIALPNTKANLETCGILCGTLISNALFISKLVIPEQKSTSDTCETVNESDLFDYIDGEDLMVLGWIHTHPTQTCFMSSRDLHTHSGYQVMMPESIAIVCAPSKGDWGVFRLTDPPGMKSVLNCTQSGLFHPHAESNIYTDALRPGHVYEAKGLEFDVVDMRH